PAASSRGAPEVFRRSVVRAALVLLLQPVINRTRKPYNSVKILETTDVAKSLSFSYLVSISGRDFCEFLGRSAGPFDGEAIHLIGLSDAKRQRAFRLRQIAGATVHHPHLADACMENPHHRPDCIAIRFRSRQIEP